ncbi:hypothetical protein I7I50_03115 [Histoplasma capsulatum G186AR]|nr:hypothetical protein I7I50_03115 [Histoplasma capsulatum G186AR]
MKRRPKSSPPHRGRGIDHTIELIKEDGKDPQPPWGPLYSMSRDELLVLRKTLNGLLDKGFIRVSNSPAAAPVLFAKKPGGGLRFCVDYRGLNKITRKDRYPLPLINETLERIGKAKWFTKLDISAAFYKIRINEGDEWLTAFRTRYGLYEWTVTPFGLANAPSTFQKYINWALRDLLDEIASAYMDDILIFTDGSLAEHRKHVRQVLDRLREAGLQVDIDKCDFETKSTTYLGFIIEAERGVRMDPKKVEAILNWEAPVSVKGTRSFLGFANFYRRFIKDFSDIARPLTDLTRKDAVFQWTNEASAAFKKLKHMFTSAPMLQSFDPDKHTILETDASGYVVGGALMQYDNEGVLRPCAFTSKKMSPAECNYEIYDKELLAIIRCLEEWESELMSVEKFEIVTDHKNLEYFTTTRKLTERHMRWSLFLSRFSFTIRYRPGVENTLADALSRREQDMPSDDLDDRWKHREHRLIDPAIIKSPTQPDEPHVRVNQSRTQDPSLEEQWRQAAEADEPWQQAAEAVRSKAPRFPAGVYPRTDISACSIDDDNCLRFRDRRWVPDSEPLRTRIMQEIHDSPMTGHPGREIMYSIIAREFYWPDMSKDVRRFVRNCDRCGSVTAWRERRKGMLKPLPVPERTWRDIAIDFAVSLPESGGSTNVLVIVDRLSKGVILQPCDKMDAEVVADAFVRSPFYRMHGLPSSIVSDRGSQFVSALWTRVCQLLRIERKLSTAYHPETDGATERMIQTVKNILRKFCNYAQDDWSDLLPHAEIAINGRDSATTGVSPFFLLHGYDLEILDFPETPRETTYARSPVQAAENIVSKLKKAREWAEASMASAQQDYEDQANTRRSPATRYSIGDKVWLDLKNIKTDRPSRTLDYRHAKYTVTEVLGTHDYRLNTPPGIHDVFHTNLLRPAAEDPFPSQKTSNWQPPAIVGEDNELEWEIEAILDDRTSRRRREYLVKWVGYDRPTWEPAPAMKDTAALDAYESSLAPVGGDNVTG